MLSCLAYMLGKILLATMLVQAAANVANGVIRGQILIPSVRSAERIMVTVQRSDGPIVARVFSDALGNYEARNLPVGTYEVVVNVEGYEEIRQQVGVGGNTFNNVTVNIPLREKESIVIKHQGADDDVVDIAELGRKYPRKAVQDYEKAREELRKGNDTKAIELLLSVVKLAPDLYSAHNTLGALYQKTQRFREAEALYRQARKLNPRTPEPLVNLGSLLIDEAAARAQEGEAVTGKILDDALDILEESLRIKRTAKGYYFLGTAYYRSKFFEEAETNLKLALEMEPRLASGQLMLANVYIRQRKWAPAVEQLDAYLTDNPKASDRAQIQETRAKLAERIR
jgi:tetratricopeptide (TPR) repeat protein